MDLGGWRPLAGRTAVVTGGATGIGAAVARLFAAAGGRGAVLDVAPAEDPPAGWGALEADVRDDASLAAAFEGVRAGSGRVDVLVAAAGIVPPWSGVASLELAEWDEVLAVNARGVAATLLHALPAMGEGGSIVVVASLNAWKGDPRLAAYTASKHAVLGLVRSAALELGSRGIRVNAIAPGPIATEAMLGRMRRREAELGLPVEHALAAAGALTALGRIATVDEVAGAALFLASELSSGVTGHLLPVDAGIA
jgi:NAD(P)-dependent dehydrogenase (short-subunit alcohol dehydrogenase family)